MKKIVVKFGGSNLKSNEDLNRVLNVVKTYNRPLVIVVSAFYGVTNYLEEGIQKVQQSINHIDEIGNFIRNLKKEAIESHIHGKNLQDEVSKTIDARLEELGNCLKGIHYIGDVPDFLEDKVLSFGEKLSSLLLTAILKHNGFDAEEKLPEHIGLTTFGESKNASIDFKTSQNSVQKALGENKIYVVPGFYGISPKGRIALLGRGGSDYSAASFAKLINAESLDIWKDVDGYLSSDPKLVDNPKKISNLSYKEAAELSYYGAKILHPRTVEPLMEASIPIRIFNITRDNPTLTPLSIINHETNITNSVIKSVTYSDNFSVLRLSGPGVGIKPGILRRLTTLMDNHDINIISIVTTGTCINLYLEDIDLKEATLLVEEGDFHAIASITPLDSKSIVAIVGEGIMTNYGFVYRMLQAVTEEGINAEIISGGASDVAAYIVVETVERDRAIRVIHREFFN
ncbi:MAG: aspartate kinase [Spirochaetales bacterium]|nr:aspartate kinase [Spirochaetales bacterium]